MYCNDKANEHRPPLDGMQSSHTQELQELITLCRQQLGRDVPALQLPLRMIATDSLFVLSVFRLAQTCALLGDTTTARHLYQLIVPYQERVISIVAGDHERTCAAAYFVGLVAASVGDSEAAICHFERALRINRSLGAAYDAAQTRYAYASVLVLRGGPGDWEQARGLLSETVTALSAAESHSSASAPASASCTPEPDSARYIFRPDGDYWTLAFDSGPVHVRDVRGLQYIGRLLHYPHRDVHVLDLVATGATGALRPRPDDLPADGFTVTRLDDALPALDPRARRAYVLRLRDLRAEQDEAASNNDMGRTAALQREITFLAEQLLAASRPLRCTSTASPVERARISVRNAITGALKAIAPHHNELARHLRNAIRTGTTCSYAPDRRVDWAL